MGRDGWWGHAGRSQLGTGSHCSIDGQLTLGQEVFKMVEHAYALRVLHVHSFHIGHIPGHLPDAFSESHHAVVQEGPSIGVSRERVREPYTEKHQTIV